MIHLLLALLGSALFSGEGKREARTPVLVELFTSEGCSSCPPADRLLASLQKTQPLNGALIIPLSEHVDYWDGPQWRDPFSAHAFSTRQEGYVKALRVEGPYTPQMVVDGRAELVGSDEGAALRTIENSARAEKAKVDVAGTLSENVAVVSVCIQKIPANQADDVYFAVTEDDLVSHVEGGENGGRRLAHTAVVRRLQKIGTTKGASFAGEFHLPLSSGWKRKDLSIVAFVQAPGSGQVLGCGMGTLK